VLAVAAVDPVPGLEEDSAETRGLLFGATALLGLVDAGRRDHGRHDRLAGILRAEDRAPKIAGQRRPEDGAGIVARQAGKTIGGLAVGGGV